MPRIVVAACLVAAALAPRAVAQNAAVDAAFDAFFSAASRGEASARVDAVLKSRISFDDAYRRLQRGRTYGPQPTGIVRMENRTADGVEHFYAVNVPDGYDPTRRYQVRFQLHGGVAGRRSNAPVGTGSIGALAGADQIYVIPYAWADAPWWSDDQTLNLVEILDAVKRRYNVDENRVVVSGVSDGGTGAYYVAMRETTPFAAFLPLNGYLMVLAARDIDDGLIFPSNLRNKPVFAINGGRDPLYPTRVVDPYIDHLKRGGVTVDYRPQPNAGHNTAWWPDMREVFETFVREHPRQPLPDTISWEVGNSAEHHRAHWLTIDRLGVTRDDAKGLPDLNDMPTAPSPEFGARASGMRVNRVVPGSNAERIGLKPGDVVVRMNDQPMPGSMDLSEALEDTPPGSNITLLVARDNLPVELSGVYQPQVVQGPPRHLFGRGGSSGRVDLVRGGNTVTAATRGVAAFTLLLSPDQFDFSKPVKLVANGRTVFNGKLEKSLATLMKYAAVDNDRTMLFGAELRIKLD